MYMHIFASRTTVERINIPIKVRRKESEKLYFLARVNSNSPTIAAVFAGRRCLGQHQYHHRSCLAKSHTEAAA